MGSFCLAFELSKQSVASPNLLLAPQGQPPLALPQCSVRAKSQRLEVKKGEVPF